MSREIKFRAWDKHHNSMEYINDLYWFEENGIHDFNDDNYIFMQNTGLKDKNGKEIYDSDIVKVTWGSGKIVFYEVKYCGSLGYHFLRDTKNKEDDDIICIYDYSQMDVIGNVFDNPELLKNK